MVTAALHEREKISGDEEDVILASAEGEAPIDGLATFRLGIGVPQSTAYRVRGGRLEQAFVFEV